MKKQSGFTLIELLLVLAIIGIIAAIAIPALLGQREKAKAKAVQSLVANIASELSRVNDDLRETNGGAAPAAASVVGAVLNLSNFVYPAVKNPYGGSAEVYAAAAGNPGADGVVNLEAVSAYADPANSAKTYQAVIITGRYLSAGANVYPKKVVALD